MTNPKWWVPVSWTSRSSADFENTMPQLWLSPSDDSITLSDLPRREDWVILNLQQSGYYRVNYDTENWNAIKDQLLFDHKAIHILNRAQILNDAYHLGIQGMYEI